MRGQILKLFGVAVMPGVLMLAYVICMVLLATSLTGASEATWLAVLWAVGAVGAAGAGWWFGRQWVTPPSHVALAGAVWAISLIGGVTPVLGRRPLLVALAISIWVLALAAIMAITDAVVTRAGVIVAGAGAVAGAMVLVFVVPYLSAWLQLPSGEATLGSAPWWAPVAVTDSALVSSDLVNRLDAIQLVAGLTIYVTLATAFCLGHVFGVRAASNALRAVRVDGLRPTTDEHR